MKRNLLLASLLLFLFACERQPVTPDVPRNVVKDHEGNEYPIKEYGSQTWMVENMKAKTTKDGKNIIKCPANGQFSYEEPMAYYVRDNEQYSTYGRGCLYNFAAANEICPDGWHLPSVEEWRTLKNYIEKNYTGVYNDDVVTAAKAMASKSYWNDCDTVVGAPGYHSASNNTSGLGLIPVGNYISPLGTGDDPDFYNYGWRSTLWTSDQITIENGYRVSLTNNDDTVRVGGATRHQAFSVRCVKNN